MNLTPQQRDALAHLPCGGHQMSADFDAVIEELARLGLAEVRADSIGLTQRGAVEKVMMRSLRTLAH